MKKYRNYKVGLLIGLLSLNTLSSCVSTRQELGMARTRRHEMGCTQGNWKRYSNRHPIQAKVCKVCTAVVGAGIIGGGIYGLSHLINPSNALNPNMHNGTNVTTIPSFTSTGWNTSTTPYNTTSYNMDEETAQSIIDAIEKGKTRWGTDQTSSDGNTSTTPYGTASSMDEETTQSTIRAIGKSEPKWDADQALSDGHTSTISTTQAPGDGAIVKSPMVLDNRIKDDLEKHNYSAERVKHWLAKGLNINARDEYGDTLLMYLACYEEDSVQFVIDQGADVNAQNKEGMTSLMLVSYPEFDNPANESIIDLLLANGADPCIRDNSGWTVLFYLKYLSDSEAKARIKEKLDAAIEKRYGAKECPEA